MAFARRLAAIALALALAYTGAIPALAQPAPEAASLTYVAIGASDTVGVGATDPAHEGWVPRLGAMLGPDTRVVNLGRNASLLHDAVRDQLPAAVAANPDVVTVWLAVNDFNAAVALSQYRTDLDLLLGALQEQTHATILVGNIPDLTSVANYTGVPPILLWFETYRWNYAIQTVANGHGATVVDLQDYWSELEQHPEYVSSDGFHPSSLGYARLADIFLQTYRTLSPEPEPVALQTK